MEPILEHRLELGGTRTRALELEGDGSPLILLHGFADSAGTWRPLLDLLRKRGRAAVALDMPGFGQAGHLDPERPVLSQLDAFAAAAVEHWAAESGGPVGIAGNSIGGTVAMRAAEHDQERIAGISPIAPAGLDTPAWFAAIQGAPLVRAMLSSPVPVPESTLRRAVGSTYRVLAFARPSSADDGVVGAFTSHFRTSDDLARMLDAGNRLLPEIRQPPFELQRIRCEVLVIWGERDRMVPSKGSEQIVAAIPEARVELLPRCGHCPQIEATERLAELLAGFCLRGS